MANGRTLPNIIVFDDAFVDQNVHSGLAVSAEHRQNLHHVIVGKQGVQLAERVESLTQQIADLQRDIRQEEASIPAHIRYDLPIDDFCKLGQIPDVGIAIQDAERHLEALKQAETIAATRIPTVFTAAN